MSDFVKEFLYPLGVATLAAYAAYYLSLKESGKQQQKQQVENDFQRLIALVGDTTLDVIALSDKIPTKVENKILDQKVNTIAKAIERFSKVCNYDGKDTKALRVYRQAATGLDLNAARDADKITKASEGLINHIETIEKSFKK